MRGTKECWWSSIVSIVNVIVLPYLGDAVKVEVRWRGVVVVKPRVSVINRVRAKTAGTDSPVSTVLDCACLSY